MRYFYLIAFSVFSYAAFLSNSYAIEAEYNCDTNGNGKVSTTSELSSGGWKNLSLGTCYAPAESFEIVFDSIALCTANPETEYGAGRNIDDTCTYVLNRTDDQVTVNMSNAASTSFPAILPGVGTYTHALLVTSKFYKIKAEIEFENGLGVAANDARDNQSSGNFCGPPLEAQGNYSVSTFYDFASFTLAQTLANCYATSRNASKNTGVLNTDSLLPTEFSNSATGLGLLLDSDYNLASDESDTVYYLFPYEFATPVTVNAETTSMNYKFSTDQAHRIWYMTVGVGSPHIIVLMSYLGDFNLVVEAE